MSRDLDEQRLRRRKSFFLVWNPTGTSIDASMVDFGNCGIAIFCSVNFSKNRLHYNLICVWSRDDCFFELGVGYVMGLNRF